MVAAPRRWFASVLPLLSMIGVAHAEGSLKFSSSSFPVPMPGGGEISSVVVPPGKKMTQCPNGRVLIANDNLGPGWGMPKRFDGIVSGVDLLTGSAMKTSTHDQPLPGTDYEHNWSSDKNMVSLPNGDIIYQTQSFSKRPVTAAGTDISWVNTTFHFNAAGQLDFGPGARTVQVTWRSVDCGETFQYVGEADPTKFSKNGECAYPQSPAFQQPDNRIFYSMGGSDGPWLGVDRKTGALLLTYGCVGNFPMGKTPGILPAGVPTKCLTPQKAVLPTGVTNIPPAPKQQSAVFRLSDCKLKRAYVLRSTDQGPGTPLGKDWTPLGSIDSTWWMWRASAVPLAQNKVAVGWGGEVFLGTPAAGGKLNFKSIFNAGIGSGYSLPQSTSDKVGALGIGGPLPNILTRVPGASGKVLLAVPSTFPVPTTNPQSTHGYRIFIVNTATGKSTTEPEDPSVNIVPAGRTAGDLIMHLTAIDTGEGPIFLYWHDVSTASDSATIRGRVYFAEDIFEEFVISKSNGNDASFALLNSAGAKYSYRDYKMAEGFRKADDPIMTKTYQYFPVWMQPENGGTAHFMTVSLNMPSDNKLQTDKGLIHLFKRPMRTRPPPPSLRPSPVTADQLRFLEQHQKQRGPQR